MNIVKLMFTQMDVLTTLPSSFSLNVISWNTFVSRKSVIIIIIIVGGLMHGIKIATPYGLNITIS